MNLDLIQIGREAKDRYPGQYDQFPDLEVGIAYAETHLADLFHHEGHGLFSNWWHGVKTTSENHRLLLETQNRALRIKAGTLMMEYKQALQRDELANSAALEKLKQDIELVAYANDTKLIELENQRELVLQARERGVDVSTLMSMKLEVFKAALEVKKTRAMKRVDLIASRNEHREKLRFLQQTKEIEDGMDRNRQLHGEEDSQRQNGSRHLSSGDSGSVPEEDS